MSCVRRRTTASLIATPTPCTGDNETKSRSILGRMARPIAFLSRDRYTPHVSQPPTRHLGEAEPMRWGRREGGRQ